MQKEMFEELVNNELVDTIKEFIHTRFDIEILGNRLTWAMKKFLGIHQIDLDVFTNLYKGLDREFTWVDKVFLPPFYEHLKYDQLFIEVLFNEKNSRKNVFKFEYIV